MEDYTIYLSEFQSQKLKRILMQKSKFLVTHTKGNEWEPVKLILHKRQMTKIEKCKNENKGRDIDLFYKKNTSKSSNITDLISSR